VKTTAQCSSCNASIFWAVTATNQKRIPIDAKPDPNGRIRIEEKGPGHCVAHVEKSDAGTLFPGDERFTSHFATCPDAAKFRQPRPQKPTVAGRMKVKASMTVRNKGEPRS